MQLTIAFDPTDASDIAEAEALLRSLHGSGSRDELDARRANDADEPPSSIAGDADAADDSRDARPTSTTLKDDDWDYALELLFTVGRKRQGSLAFLKQTLTYAPGHGYTYAEIAADMGLDEAEVKAFRRNLGRALSWIERDELPGMPDLFRSWKEGSIWRYEATAEVRAAAKRRGLI